MRSRTRRFSSAAGVAGVVLGLLLSGILQVGTVLPASAAPAATAASKPGSAMPDLPALRTVMAVLDIRADRVPNSVTGWYADPATHSVVISATDMAAARTFAAGLRAVRIEHVTSRPRLFSALRGGDTITSTEGGRCSVGFNAISGGTRYVITAGHCTKLGGTWSGPDGNAIGPVAKTTFPGYDFGLVEVASPAWEQTHDVDGDSGTVTVSGATPAAVGDPVCLSGSTSGHHCGRIEAFGETVNYGDGAVVRGLTKTSVCAEEGDSGGPFMSGNQAQGTLSGGTGGCLLGGQSYFQPIGQVLSTYGLTLITGQAAADPR